MSYKLNVLNPDGTQALWFRKFLKESGYFKSVELSIDDCVTPWGARDLITTEFIEFDTAENRMLFILRWQDGD